MPVTKRKIIDLTKTKKKKRKVIDLTKTRKKKAAKKKKPIAKKKKPVAKKKKYSHPYIGQDSFTPKELKQYLTAIKKLKKKKKTVKQKKVGLTNLVSFLNLMYNADKEKRKLPRKNLMVAHPFKYPSLIQNVDVNAIWKATSLPSRGTKNAIISNVNDVYRHLVGYNLMMPFGTISDPIHIGIPNPGARGNPISVD